MQIKFLKKYIEIETRKDVVIRGLQEPSLVFSLGVLIQYWLIRCFWCIMRTNYTQRHYM